MGKIVETLFVLQANIYKALFKIQINNHYSAIEYNFWKPYVRKKCFLGMRHQLGNAFIYVLRGREVITDGGPNIARAGQTYRGHKLHKVATIAYHESW